MPGPAATAAPQASGGNTGAEATGQTPAELLRALVARTRAAQGLPPKVEDSAALARIEHLLRDPSPATERPPRRTPTQVAA